MIGGAKMIRSEITKIGYYKNAGHVGTVAAA